MLALYYFVSGYLKRGFKRSVYAKPVQLVVVIGWLFVQLMKDEDKLKLRNNKSQLIVNCVNNHPITSLL